MEVKSCSKCGIEKDLIYFSYRNDTKKYRNHCKLCMYEKDKEWKEKNSDRMKLYQKEYQEKNKEKISKNSKKILY